MTATDGTNTATTFTDRIRFVSVSSTSATVSQGGSTSATVTVTASPTEALEVDLWATGQPTGVKVSLSPRRGKLEFTSTMSISVALTTTPGTYSMNITVFTGNPGEPSYSVKAETLTVTAIPHAEQEITISGYKFHDRNGNGVWESGEEGLGGHPTIEKRYSLELVNSTITGEDGSYIFAATQNGRYGVVELPRDGWIQTAPPNGFYEFDLTGSINNRNFGNRLAPIGGELLPLDLSAHILRIAALVALASFPSLILGFKKPPKTT